MALINFFTGDKSDTSFYINDEIHVMAFISAASYDLFAIAPNKHELSKGRVFQTAPFMVEYF